MSENEHFCCDIPYLHYSIVTSRSNVFAIWRPGHNMDSIGMPVHKDRISVATSQICTFPASSPNEAIYFPFGDQARGATAFCMVRRGVFDGDFNRFVPIGKEPS